MWVGKPLPEWTGMWAAEINDWLHGYAYEPVCLWVGRPSPVWPVIPGRCEKM